LPKCKTHQSHVIDGVALLLVAHRQQFYMMSVY